MIISASLKKTLGISVLGHLALFSIFSFSFGDRILKLNFSRVSSLGAILSNADLIRSQTLRVHPKTKTIFIKRPDTTALDKIKQNSPLISGYYFKPSVNISFAEDKTIFKTKTETLTFIQSRKESSIIFHPLLPYHFLIYFKDRQSVHIELMFNITSSGITNSIIIKRKISSGNLEADLLAMRYIEQYLFIQQRGFPVNNWQTVKIDLSAKND
jgi:hypothetical protein